MCALHALQHQVMHHAATLYNTLLPVAVMLMQHTASHSNTLTHSNTLQHTAAHCNILQHTATHCSALLPVALVLSSTARIAKHYNILQHTATYCNILLHGSTDAIMRLSIYIRQMVHDYDMCQVIAVYNMLESIYVLTIIIIT